MAVRYVQHEDDLCCDSRNLGLELNGCTTTHDVLCFFFFF